MNYFLNKNLQVRKLSQNGTSKFTYSATGTVYKCNLQNATPEEQQYYDGQQGNLYDCYVDYACPAVISDKVTIDIIVYKVRGVKNQDFGSFTFKKLILSKAD